MDRKGQPEQQKTSMRTTVILKPKRTQTEILNEDEDNIQNQKVSWIEDKKTKKIKIRNGKEEAGNIDEKTWTENVNKKSQKNVNEDEDDVQGQKVPHVQTEENTKFRRK